MKRDFFILHFSAIILHALCFIYSIMTKTGYNTPIYTLQKTIKYENTTLTYYDINDEFLVKLPSVVFIHGFVALVTILFHGLFYLPIHYKFANVVWNQKYFTLRWFEYSITCTSMTISSVMSSGTNDFNFVITAISLGIALQLLGSLIEQIKHQWRILLLIGLCIELGIGWSLIWYTISSQNISQYQWIETISFLFYYSLFPLNCILDAIYRENNFIRTDWIYNVLSLTSKFALFWIQVGELERVYLGGIWPEIQIYCLGIIVPLIILIIGIYNVPSMFTIKPEKYEQINIYWKIMYNIATFKITTNQKPQIIYVKQKNRLRV